MATSRAERRRARAARVTELFGADITEAALDLLELIELAWHDCYGEVTPRDDVVDDILVVSSGTLHGLIRSGRLAISDPRDLRVAADAARSGRRP